MTDRFKTVYSKGNNFVIDNNDNKIGINKASPEESLDVSGNIKFSGDIIGNIKYNNLINVPDFPRKINDVSQNVIDLSDNVYTKSHIDTSFNTLDTKVNNLTGNVYTKSHIDTSFNTLDTNVNNLTENVYTKSHIDTSFNTLDTKVNNLTENVYTKSHIDTSFNTLDTKVNNLTENVYTKSHIDTSFNTLDTKVNNLTENVYTKSHIDTSFNTLDTSINTLDTKVNNLTSNVYTKSHIDTSFNTLDTKVNNLTENVYTKSHIDTSFNTLDTNVNNLTSNVYTKSHIDTSFNTLDTTLRTYIDNAVSGLDIKESVKVASVNNIDLSTTVQQIDNINISDGDRILLKDQANATENGIYELSGTNLVRTSDFDSSTTVTYGAFTFVEQGNENSDKGFVLTNVGSNSDNITIGTTELTFSQFSGAGQLTAGDGLTKTGDTMQINVDNTTLNIVNDTLQIHSNYTSKIDISFNNIYTKAEVDNKLSNNISIIDVLNDISNVNVDTKNDGDILKWNEARQIWVSEKENIFGNINSQVLEYILCYYNDNETIKTNNANDISLPSITGTEVTLSDNVTLSQEHYDIDIISNYKPPLNTNDIIIEYSFFVTSLNINSNAGIFSDDILFESILLLDDNEIILSQEFFHFDLIEKYVTVKCTFNIDLTKVEDLSKNILNNWDNTKNIKLRLKFLTNTSQTFKIHYSNKNNIIMKPILKIIAVGENSKSPILEYISHNYNNLPIQTNNSGILILNTPDVHTLTTDISTNVLVDNYKPPDGTTQVLIEYKFFVTKSEDDAVLECELYIDDESIPNTKQLIHLDLVEKFVGIKGVYDVSNNWKYDRNINLRIKSMYYETNNIVKIHYSNRTSNIVNPFIEIIAIGMHSRINNAGNNINEIIKLQEENEKLNGEISDLKTRLLNIEQRLSN